MTDNLVKLAERRPDAPVILTQKQPWEGCRHEHALIDERLRTVDCADCGQERLDPIEVLIYLAREDSHRRREAEKYEQLIAEYRRHERDAWERKRDRHLRSNPSHESRLNEMQLETGWSTRGECRQCVDIAWKRPRHVAPPRAIPATAPEQTA